VQFDGEKPDKITRGACNDDEIIFVVVHQICEWIVGNRK